MFVQGVISTLNGGSLKLVDKFTYLNTIISSSESDYIHLVKTWTVIDRLSIIWRFDLFNKIKWDFFQAVVVSILYGCTTGTLTKCIKKKLDRNRTRMLRVIVNKSWKQHLAKQHLYSHLRPISKTSQDMQDTAEEARMNS